MKKEAGLKRDQNQKSCEARRFPPLPRRRGGDSNPPYVRISDRTALNSLGKTNPNRYLRPLRPDSMGLHFPTFLMQSGTKAGLTGTKFAGNSCTEFGQAALPRAIGPQFDCGFPGPETCTGYGTGLRRSNQGGTPQSFRAIGPQFGQAAAQAGFTNQGAGRTGIPLLSGKGRRPRKGLMTCRNMAKPSDRKIARLSSLSPLSNPPRIP